MPHRRWLVLTGLVAAVLMTPAEASADCEWSVQGRVRALVADCEVFATLEVPDGVTIDGRGHRLRVTDPPAGAFSGAVVLARGRRAHVRDLVIDASALGRGCEQGDQRLTGIRFDGASGTIDGVTLESVARLDGRCAEGVSIEVLGAGAKRGPDQPQAVAIRGTSVRAYQKAGLVASGAVFVMVESSSFVASGEPLLPSNAVQVSFGARATLARNRIAATSWCCSSTVASGILLLDAAPGTEVLANRIEGNADVGIFAVGRGYTITDNTVTDNGPDGLFDIGILLMGGGHYVRHNDVRGFTVPADTRGPDDGVAAPHIVAE